MSTILLALYILGAIYTYLLLIWQTVALIAKRPGNISYGVYLLTPIVTLPMAIGWPFV